MDVSGGNVMVGSDQGSNPPSRPGRHTWSDAQALWQAQHGIAAVHGGSELFLDGQGWSTGEPRPTHQEVKSLEVLQEAPKKPHHHLSSV